MTILQQMNTKLKTLGACDATVARDTLNQMGWLRLSVAEKTCRCGGIYHLAFVGVQMSRGFNVREGCTFALRCTDCGKEVSL